MLKGLILVVILGLVSLIMGRTKKKEQQIKDEDEKREGS